MVKPGQVLFLASLAWFGVGAWTYETSGWTHYPRLFQGGTAFLLGTGLFLLWVPRKRGQKAPLIGAGLVFFLFILSLIPLTQTIAWSGAATREISVRAVDTETGTGIPWADVAVFHSLHASHKSVGETDMSGQVRLQFEFSSSGPSSLFRQTGGFSLSGVVVEVSSPFYESVLIELEPITGSFRRLDAPPIPEFEVGLAKKLRR